MRHFAHNIGDYAAATAHLSFVEDAAYHRLLRRYYQDEKPLPAALTDCQRLVGARSKDEREAVRVVLEEFFTLQADGWHQARADREIEVYRAKAEAARENGTKGGRPANRKKTNPVSAPVQSQKLTTPHSPSSDPNGSGGDAPPDPVKALFDAGVELLTSTGTKPGHARSMIGKWRGEHGDEAVMASIGAAKAASISEPLEWITKRLAAIAKPGQPARREDWNERRYREAMEAIRQ